MTFGPPDLCILCYRSSGEGLVMDALTAAHHHHHLPVPTDGPLWPENHEELSCIWDEAPPVYLQYWRCSVLCLPVKRGGLTKTLMHVTKLIRADDLSLSSTPPTSYVCWMWAGFWNERGCVSADLYTNGAAIMWYLIMWPIGLLMTHF